MPGITGLTNTAANSISNTFAKQSGKAAESTAVIAGGSRLTKASVDASSLALSEKLRSNIEVLTQASRNTAQGASVVQLAVGAQQNILNLLTSMKSLTTKANDGSQDTNSRALINKEYQKLLAQIDNIAAQVRWNGTSLLTGGVSMAIQVAELSTDTITLVIADSTATTLAINTTDVTTQANAVTAGGLIDTASQTINSSIASLGSQQKQLEIASDNLKTTIENNVAARGVYNDADIPEEMAKLTQATVFTQLSQAMLSQAMELQKGLVQLAR